MDKKLFGTDGIRGVANVEPMTAEVALRLGRAAAHVFRQDERKHRFVIGKDTRLSGYLYENALVAGICSMGDDAILVGPLPSPGISFITRSLRADAGIVISASHNSFEYNGIKFFSPSGYKLPDEMETKMEELVLTGSIDSIRPTHDLIGKAYRIEDAEGRYVEFVKNSVPKISFESLKVVLDCANGAAYRVAPKAFTELGAEVVVLHDKPDGKNINENCGSMHPEVVQKAVLEHKANIGFAFDGDADRVIAVSEKGEILDGDYILAIAAKVLKEENRLKNAGVVGTVMSNMGLQMALKELGIDLKQSQVGDRYVMEAMKQDDFLLGGEQSGHIIFKEFSPTGDGLLTALQLARIVKSKGKTISELGQGFVRFPQYIKNITVKQKIDLNKLPEVLHEKEKIETDLGKDGRILLRYSGTEPMIRVMVESRRELDFESYIQNLVQALDQNLNEGVKVL